MKWRIKLALVLLILIMFFSTSSYYFSRSIEPLLIATAKQEVQSSLNQLIHHCVSAIEYEPKDLLHIVYDDKTQVQSVQVDSRLLNDILYDAMSSVNESLRLAIEGEVDPITQQVYFDSGVVDYIPLGAFTNIAAFSEFGPKLKIKIRMINRVSGTYEISNEEYGINSTLLKIAIKIEVVAEVFAGISRETIHLEEEIPIVLQLLQGNVPTYVPYLKQG